LVALRIFLNLRINCKRYRSKRSTKVFVAIQFNVLGG
jgi:hypothetical protein